MTQDLRLEPLELRAGLDPQLLDEPRARVLVRVERLGLPARAVEGQHELAAEASRGAGARDERLELADDVAVAAELEIGLDPLLERDQPKLLEPPDLGLRELLERELGERGPRQSASACSSCSRRSAGGSRLRVARSCSNRRASICSGSTRSTYPGARVSSTSAPSSLRS